MQIDTGKLFEKNVDRILKKEDNNYPCDNEVDFDCDICKEDLLKEVEDDFSYQIRERGKNYYNDGNVIMCCKCNNYYYGKVRGTGDEPYNVKIKIEDGEVNYDCDCPYEYPCKHEYALLMAILNQEYQAIELKPEISEKRDNLQNLIEKIPAEEIKEYLLSPKGLDYVCFEMNSFEEYFRKYYPNQSYYYYYNNLFNSLKLNNNYINLTSNYIQKSRQYISNQEFTESFKILKSIIEAYNDTNCLNFEEYINSVFPELGMLLRVTYRKALDTTKLEIKEWINRLETNNYYNNFYLEDIVLTMNI